MDKNITILHISDLHFGFNFNEAKWGSLKNHTKEKIQPDLIVITGDVVNSPWSRELKKVRENLDEFGEQIGKTIPIRIIPGNHDTRICGLFPIICPLIGTLFFSLVFFQSVSKTGVSVPNHCSVLQAINPIFLGQPLLTWVWLVISLLLFAIWLCLTSDLKSYLGNYFLDKTEVFSDLGIGLVPYDSSSFLGGTWLKLWTWSWISSARGHIKNEIFVDRQSEINEINQNKGKDIVWIGLTHHHPLPLPYDHDAEDMMVMDNAGAFLSELTALGIKLVLHGHKHHQHFSRISINPTRHNRATLAVLSAGTPTQNNNPGAFRHGFNVIKIDKNGKLNIEMYEAPPNGGTYNDPFEIIPVYTDEEFNEECFNASKKDLKTYCERMICIADINEFGDGSFRREIYGIKTEQNNLTSFFSFIGSVTDGTVEAFKACQLTDNGPSITIQTEPNVCRSERVEAKVTFPGGLKSSHPPIDIITQFEANNVIALNEWQLKCMRLSSGSQGQKDRIENVRFMVFKEFAAEELMLVIKFPKTIDLPKRTDLLVDGIHTDETQIFRMETQNILQAIIKHPRCGANYEINWDVDREIDTPQGRQHAVFIRTWLWNNRSDPAIKSILDFMVIQTLKIVIEHLFPKSEINQFNVALFAYNSNDGRLDCVADNYDSNDNRKNWSFKFGHGLPGRAFKSATIAGFIKPANIDNSSYVGYVRGDGNTVQQACDIPESVILTFPLYPIDAPDWPYGVLQISTDDPSTYFRPSDQALATVKASMSSSWTKKLVELQSPKEKKDVNQVQ